MRATPLTTLCTADAKAYRSDVKYMNHVEFDPIFNATLYDNKGNLKIPSNLVLSNFVNDKVQEYGGKLRTAILRENFDIDHNVYVKKQRAQSKKMYPKEDMDLAFPLKDLRKTPGVKTRTAQANRNLLRLHFAVEELWKQVISVENMRKKEYDYVLFLRDDSQWMIDFDLNKLVP